VKRIAFIYDICYTIGLKFETIYGHLLAPKSVLNALSQEGFSIYSRQHCSHDPWLGCSREIGELGKETAMRDFLGKTLFTFAFFAVPAGLLYLIHLVGVEVNPWIALFPAIIWAHWFAMFSEVRHYRSMSPAAFIWMLHQVILLIFAYLFSGQAFNVRNQDNTWWLGVAVLPFLICPLYVRILEGEQRLRYPLFWKDVKYTTLKMWNWYTPPHLAIMLGLLYLSTRSLTHIPYMERIEAGQLQFLFQLFYFVFGSVPFWMPYLATEMEPEPMFPREPEDMTRNSNSYV
jgi:hypothetical protein